MGDLQNEIWKEGDENISYGTSTDKITHRKV